MLAMFSQLISSCSAVTVFFMIFIVQSAKMTVNRRANPGIQVDGCEQQPSLWNRVARIMRGETTRRNRAISDLIVIVIALPLLVLSSVLLHSCMRADWVRDVSLRWRILGLGLLLLFVSLLVCLYATHRLGLCFWASSSQDLTQPSTRTRRRTISSRGVLPVPLLSTDSQMQLMAGGELPPSYDSVIRSTDLPPPYCGLILQNEKAEYTRSMYASLQVPATG